MQLIQTLRPIVTNRGRVRLTALQIDSVDWLTFLNGFSYASIGSVLIPIVCYFRKERRGVQRVLLFLLLASLASDVGNEIYVRSGLRGYAIYNLFFAVQITLIGLIYWYFLSSKKIVRPIILGFWLVFILYTLLFQSINEYQSAIRVMGGLIVLGFSTAFYFQLYRSLSVENLFKYLPSWINMAVFFYFSFNLFLFLIANYVFKHTSQQIGMVFWGFHNFNNVIKNCLLAVGLLISDD